jgi:hypothetical protein
MFKAARVPANVDQAINVRDICAVRLLVVAIRALIASLISYASPIILKPGLLALAILKTSPRSIWMNRSKRGCWMSIEDPGVG